MPKRGKLVDLALYIGISAAIIGCAAWFFASGHDWQSFVKWCGFPSATFVLFWVACVEGSPGFRENQHYWSINFKALAVHSVAWIALLSKVHEWKFIWYGPMLIEMMVFLPIRRALMSRLNQRLRPND